MDEKFTTLCHLNSSAHKLQRLSDYQPVASIFCRLHKNIFALNMDVEMRCCISNCNIFSNKVVIPTFQYVKKGAIFSFVQRRTYLDLKCKSAKLPFSNTHENRYARRTCICTNRFLMVVVKNCIHILLSTLNNTDGTGQLKSLPSLLHNSI
jgi:hypothetical protein